MNLATNPQIDLAYEYIQYTNKNIFLTGKAGTGKTTFLRRIKSESIKRTVVVAPTGVAAINAQGMTIHSFFQLPFGPFIPDNNTLSQQRGFSRKKIDLIKSLDLLIIDEVSMVRADLLDGIDEVLRRYRNFTKPFGGVQLLMIGDLHQLPPVVKPDDWNILSPYYRTAYFFGSRALQRTDAITIELKHIYRQSDSFFIDLLNKVRNNQLDEEVLSQINSRYIKDFEPNEEDGYITLTSHNATAQRVNDSKLKAISERLHQFTATIQGDFPPHIYPTEEVLEFKVGAQIVFIKNDLSFDKRYYNGKIGKIVKINHEEILVKCPNEVDLISVLPVEWSNVKYDLNEETKEVTEQMVGTFTQYPLKLAWAITIHKSQGLTFERAIIDAKAAFAHGQVYVALSRCKSFEGIVLLSKIGQSSVKTDSVVRNYSENASKNEPDKTHLKQSKKTYQEDVIREIFDFRTIQKHAKGINRIIVEQESNFAASPMDAFKQFIVQAENEVFSIANKFQLLLGGYFKEEILPEKNEKLTARIEKGSVYFVEKLKKGLLPALANISIVTDNKTLKKRITDAFERLEKSIYIKNACFETLTKDFSIRKYIKIKANAELDFAQYKRVALLAQKVNKIPTSTPHPKLYAQLLQWREEEAEAKESTDYEILPTRSLLELVQFLPTNKSNLQKIRGIGSVKVKMYGLALIDIIDKYCADNGLGANTMKIPFSKKPKKKKRQDTKVVSFDLFNEGKTVSEIALERGLTPTTIEGHLAHFVALGKVDVFSLMKRHKVEEIVAFCKREKTTSKATTKKHFGDKYTYGEIRMALSHLQSGNES